MGAMMMCTMGMAPSNLVVLPINTTFTDQQPDRQYHGPHPVVNIMPFQCITGEPRWRGHGGGPGG
jgi:hypothetical protein